MMIRCGNTDQEGKGAIIPIVRGAAACAPLPCQQMRLHRVCSQAHVLHQRAGSKGAPLHPEGARDMARQIAKSRQGRTSRRMRKKIEMLFAHLKRILKLDRLRLRGPNVAHDDFLLAAAAQNLRKLAKLIPQPRLNRPDSHGRRRMNFTSVVVRTFVPHLFRNFSMEVTL